MRNVLDDGCTLLLMSLAEFPSKYTHGHAVNSPTPFQTGNAGIRATEKDGETSAAVRARVEKAWALQLQRSGVGNARLRGEQLDTVCEADDQSWSLLEAAAERFNLSARAHQRVLRVARTIADMADDKKIASPHVAEALSLRSLDRQS